LDVPMIEMRRITKSFPGVAANQEVDFEVRPGEVHALLGENGAGKSTLMNILSGIYQPDDGEILVNSQPVAFARPADAIAAGIGMVHQHFRLVEAFTVAENLHLGWHDTPRWTSRRRLRARSEALAAQYGLSVAPEARVYQLSAGEQQRIEILRVLARGARLLILDEPTAVLTPEEATILFRIIRQLAQDGYSIIFISHKLDEVLEISDRITILRGGRKVASLNTADCDHGKLAGLMVGKDVIFGQYAKTPTVKEPVIRLSGVRTQNDRGMPGLIDIDLDIRAGEILGVAGVAGNGQRELTEVLTGVRRIHAGRIEVDGRDLTNQSPARFADAKIGHIPEDRIRSGIAPGLSLVDNAILREYRRPPLSRGIWLKPRAAERFTAELLKTSDVSAPTPFLPIRNLSGGNQQRFVTHREVRIAKRALIAAYPTRGLDVGATDTVRRVLVDLRNAGVAVVLVSEDLDEIFAVADRLIVMYEGRIMGERAAPATREEIGMLMGGVERRGQLH
jgi:ABC-type uncharacterized transport system ATPase subunit